MFQKTELKRLFPLGIFWGGYTIIFLVWRVSFFYTLPFLLGFLVAAALQPGVAFLQRRFHVQRGPASALLAALALGVLLASLCLLVYFSIRELASFLVRAAEGGFPAFSPPVRAFFQKVRDTLQELDWDLLQRSQQEWMSFLQNSMETVTAILSGLMKLLSSLPTLAALLLVTAVSSYFFTRDLPRVRRWVRDLLSPKARQILRAAKTNSSGTGRKYLLSYVLLYFISFCEAFVVLSVVGVPYPFLTALLTCAADILPVFGPGLVFLPVAVYQLLTGAYAKAAGILIGWVIMSLLRQLVEPKLVASTTKIHPLAMMAGVYFSLAAGDLWILFYVLGLCMSHSALRSAGALPPLLKPKKPPPEAASEGG